MWDVIYCIHYKKKYTLEISDTSKKCYFCDARIQLWSGAIPECYTYIDYKGRFLSFLFSVALYATRQKLQQGQ